MNESKEEKKEIPSFLKGNAFFQSCSHYFSWDPGFFLHHPSRGDGENEERIPHDISSRIDIACYVTCVILFLGEGEAGVKA